MPSSEHLRRRYRPDDVRVLFVGESPPAGATFFYSANSKLYSATRKAFAQAIPELGTGGDFLDVFQALGCYLEDLSPVAVNHLSLTDAAERRERRALRRKGIPALADRLTRMQPREIVVVMKDVERDVSEALDAAGLSHVPRSVLPFPARHEPQYVEQLAQLVRSWLPLIGAHEAHRSP